MRIEKRTGFALLTMLLAASVAAGTGGGEAAGPPQARVDPGAGAAGSTRGQYIVTSVAMCIQCHSPRDAEGNVVMSEAFMGAPMPIRSPYVRVEWALRAPRIAGLPGYTRDEAIRLLMEGVNRNTERPRPPMPPFRMSREDAEAVADFLQALK
jgi:mono/diheme cytochrome c family protein